MKCLWCGAQLEMLPQLYYHSGRQWFGCKKCNLVYNYDYCSVTGLPADPVNPLKQFHLSYAEYMERIEEKDKKNS